MPSEPSSAYDAPIRIHSLPLLSASTLPGNNTRPRYRISCYRLVSAVSVVAFGVPKAIAAYQNAQVTATTLDWISGISLSLFIMVAGWWEQDPPPRLEWFFDTDWTPRKPNWDVYRDTASDVKSRVLSEYKRDLQDFESQAQFLFPPMVMIPVSVILLRQSWVTKLDAGHANFEAGVLWFHRVTSALAAPLSLYLFLILRRRFWTFLLISVLVMVQISSHSFYVSVFYAVPFTEVLFSIVLMGLVGGSVAVLLRVLVFLMKSFSKRPNEI
ncbi:hypothetical protein JAAARDRAFT_199290 [Jaapia argillacea MUCL 33604]|uniref:Uncharacterized protein n=1 Tax=Jaapia argillacea MUCL 33604 TaxID=933084 RepID=A0A067PBP1_9AGAM|nr:hypothetical protein JAAARDRAFT_199290 [Jaapia argillacea MUCL 33604]